MALELARERNVSALKMLLDRVWPIGRSRPLEIGAPPIKHPRDLLTAMAGVTDAMFNGDATAAESEAAAKVIKAHFNAIGDIELERRLDRARGGAPPPRRKVSNIGFPAVFGRFSTVFSGRSAGRMPDLRFRRGFRGLAHG